VKKVIPVALLRNEQGKEILQWKKAEGERLEKERIRKSICDQLNVLSSNLSAGTNEMTGKLNHGARKMNFFLSFFLSFLFIILTPLYLFVLDVEGYCST
jgi:hypothetical protein